MKARFIIAAALVATASPSVFADEPIPAKARSLADKGREAHDHGDYPRAIAAFKEAYVIAPAPALLFNLAQAYRLQGNCEDAQMMYRRYIGTNPSEDGRALAEAHLATVERCIQKRSLNIPMDQSASYLQVKVPPADLGIVDAPIQRSHPGRMQKRIGGGVALGGTALLAVAGYYALEARAAARDVEAGYAMGGDGPKGKELAERDAEGRRFATTAKLAGIGGGLALATGVTLFVLGRHTERMSGLTVQPTTKGAQVSASWRF
ncbi:MAG: hypothetical protein ABI867_07910 [Kofleriaceae bacterium]